MQIFLDVILEACEENEGPHPEERRIFAARLEGWPLGTALAVANLRDAP